MPPAPVPETAMHQHNCVQVGEQQVHRDPTDLAARPVLDMLTAEGRPHGTFWERVTAPYSRHHLAAFGRGPDVGHGLTNAFCAFSRCRQGSE